MGEKKGEREEKKGWQGMRVSTSVRDHELGGGVMKTNKEQRNISVNAVVPDM